MGVKKRKKNGESDKKRIVASETIGRKYFYSFPFFKVKTFWNMAIVYPREKYSKISVLFSLSVDVWKSRRFPLWKKLFFRIFSVGGLTWSKMLDPELVWRAKHQDWNGPTRTPCLKRKTKHFLFQTEKNEFSPEKKAVIFSSFWNFFEGLRKMYLKGVAPLDGRGSLFYWLGGFKLIDSI